MRKFYGFIFFMWVQAIPVKAQFLWNEEHMHNIKKDINSISYATAFRSLVSQAELELGKKPYSVAEKKGLPPSGDKRDYVSLSRYWWPDPNKADGLPYINKDGQANPELEKYDRNTLGDMCQSVNTLSLAFFYTGNEKYARKAVTFLRTWFLDPRKRMNPNLEYSQFIPGRDNSKGRPEGLIDSYSFVEMLSSIQLLKRSSAYTRQDDEGLRQWFADFAKWFQTSKQGQQEKAAKNNHATAYDSQMIAYLLFSGNQTGALKMIHEFPEKRIFAQIEPDGRQPNELWRTLAYHYSQYNLSHMLDVCAMAGNLGINLLASRSADGRSIYTAMDYIASFLGKGPENWPYKQISGWEAKQQDICVDLLRVLDMDSSRGAYRELFQKYQRQEGTARWRLLYGVPDEIGSFFSFASSQLQYAISRVAAVQSESASQKLVLPRSVNRDGKLVLVSPRDWCSGFFPGSLWMMYRYTGNDQWKSAALQFTHLLEPEKNDRSSHDVGFKINCSYGNAYQLTRNKSYSDVMVQAAATLSKRFNARVGALRSWDFNREVWQYPVIIDNMMNLELLFEASLLSGNKEYYAIADKHAATTLKNHFRADYSSWHVVDYDTATGSARKKNTHQGFADSSAWARGQAWALYGYTMCYRYTRNPAYLKQARNIAGYIYKHPNLPADLVPFWDYNDPAIPRAPRDVSAACITAAALYELARYARSDSSFYVRTGDAMVSTLLHHYRAREQKDEGFLLLHSTGHRPHQSEVDVPVSYADYYFLEALNRRKKLENQK